MEERQSRTVTLEDWRVLRAGRSRYQQQEKKLKKTEVGRKRLGGAESLIPPFDPNPSSKRLAAETALILVPLPRNTPSVDLIMRTPTRPIVCSRFWGSAPSCNPLPRSLSPQGPTLQVSGYCTLGTVHSRYCKYFSWDACTAGPAPMGLQALKHCKQAPGTWEGGQAGEQASGKYGEGLWRGHDVFPHKARLGILASGNGASPSQKVLHDSRRSTAASIQNGVYGLAVHIILSFSRAGFGPRKVRQNPSRIFIERKQNINRKKEKNKKKKKC